MIDQKLELLQRVPLFAGVEPKQLEEISQITDEIDAPAGTALTHEGRHEGYFFVILSGSVLVERGGQTINTLGTGDFLGEIALVDGGPRTATATTVTPSRLIRLSHQRFHQLLGDSPPIRTAVFAALGRRLRSLDAESVY
jgi:CRP/FNR family cyclic AMP-dependent transcriptional regulator